MNIRQKGNHISTDYWADEQHRRKFLRQVARDSGLDPDDKHTWQVLTKAKVLKHKVLVIIIYIICVETSNFVLTKTQRDTACWVPMIGLWINYWPVRSRNTAWIELKKHEVRDSLQHVVWSEYPILIIRLVHRVANGR